MDLFDSDGNLFGEAKEVFDGDGNSIGHFIENRKENIVDAFETNWLWGLIFLFFIAPGWFLVGGVFILLFKLLKLALWLLLLPLRGIWALAKFVLRCLWWLIRLPFSLLFFGETPDF